MTLPAPSRVYALFAVQKAGSGETELNTESPIDLTDVANHSTIRSNLEIVGEIIDAVEGTNAIEPFVRSVMLGLSEESSWKIDDETLFFLEPKFPSNPADHAKQDLMTMGEGVKLTSSLDETEKDLSLEQLGQILSESHNKWEAAFLEGDTSDDGTYAVISFRLDAGTVVRTGLHIKPMIDLKPEDAGSETSGETLSDPMEDVQYGPIG